jgi:hypothetical protein
VNRPDQWLAAFVAAVRTNDTTAGRALFDQGVVGFGTRTAHVTGLDDLDADQWQQVWPLVADWEVSDVVVVNDDPVCAVLAYRWRRTNLDGSTHHGRATMVLIAANDTPAGWRCIHSHFSVNPT